MEWTKIKVKHFLFTDFSLKNHGALVKLLCLTAHLERIPSNKEMLQQVHYKSLTSLQQKLNEHSTDLQDVLNKVLEDVQRVEHKREISRSTSNRYNKKRNSVDTSIDTTDKIREDKIREDNMYEKQIDNLYTLFPLNTKPLVDEYIELIEKENKSGKILTSKRLRLVTELVNFFNNAEPERFRQALETTVKNEAPNINYLKKVYNGWEKRKKVAQKLKAEQDKKEWEHGVKKGEEAYKRTQEYIKSIQEES